MKKITVLLTIALITGTLASLSTFFYQREGSYAGVCVIGVRSPCNGDIFNDRGYPIRYVDPENELDLLALAGNIFFWSTIFFTILMIVNFTRAKR